MSPYAATWVAVLAAAALCFATKLLGHRVPTHWLEQPRVARVAGLVTVALLAALVAVQTFTTTDSAVIVDARLVAVAVAAVALALRAPFIVVVVLAAVVAAVLRAL
ncbi:MULTISPECIES: AzlD domain-containing protein [unclassified Actinotalea]|uniref:AzlD domain-containing protein n=1 Tax=unclassified Actinotalea TaxID=2638618 RepID=UPI0015F5A9BE|nr:MULTISPECIES: AzlD domain-containing protein [unclassified Actinotalea]